MALGATRGCRAASERVPMRALLPQDVEAVTFPHPVDSDAEPSLGPCDLRMLGQRLRVAYNVADEPLPDRLAELIAKLAERETVDG